MFAKNKVTQSMIDAVNSILNEDKKLLLEPEPENTTKDKKKDLKGEKETGMTHAQYEKSARDKKEDMKEGKDCVTEPEAKNIADKEVSKHEKNMHKGQKSNIKEGSFIHRLLTQVNEDKASAKNLETFTDNNMGENKKLVGKQKKFEEVEELDEVFYADPNKKKGSKLHSLYPQDDQDQGDELRKREFWKNSQSKDSLKRDMKKGLGFKALKLKEEEDLEEDISNYSIEEIEEFMQTEDYEQLDELSKKTLKSYLDKSTGRSEKIGKKWWDANLDANVSGDKKDKQKEKHLLNKTTLVDKARAGAKARMIGTSNEEVEQIDELSKKTLGSYVDKADQSVRTMARKTVVGGTPEQKKAFYAKNNAKIDSRLGNMDKAVSKMKEKDKFNTEEVEELDEVKGYKAGQDAAPRLSYLLPKHKLKPNEDKKRERQTSPVKKETNEEVELTESLIFQNETPTKHSRVTHSAFVKTHSGHLHVGDIQHGKDITGNGHDYYVSHVNGEDGGAHTEHEAKQLMHKFHKNHQKSGYKLNSKSMEEAVQTTQDKNSGKISTDTLSGRVPGGKLNSFKNFKTNLTTSGEDSVPSEIEHGEDTKEKQKISTNPGPVDIKLDDKLTGPTPYTHFSDEKSITNEKVEPALREKRKESEEENTKQIKTFASKVVESKNDKPTMSVMDRIKGVSKASFNKVKDTIGESSNEDVEMLDESAMLDQYLNSLGINPRTLTRDKKVSYAKSNAFITWKNNHEHLK